MISLGACDRTAEPSPLAIPEAFQGRWSINPETCDRNTLATQDWFFVYDTVIGSFEHLYAVATLDVSDNNLVFTTERGGPSGRLTLLEGGGILWASEAGGYEFSLCSKDPEL